MIGFTPNEVVFVTKENAHKDDDDSIDFNKIREEVTDLQSVERKDAYDDYNRAHRPL